MITSIHKLQLLDRSNEKKAQQKTLPMWTRILRQLQNRILRKLQNRSEELGDGHLTIHAKNKRGFPPWIVVQLLGKTAKKHFLWRMYDFFLPVTACDSWAYQLCFMFAVTGITDAITRKQIFLKAREISGESHSRCLLGQFTHKQQTFFCARLIEETQRKKSKSRLSLNGN